MKNASTFDEDELIAYHLGELSRLRSNALRRALETDSELAAASDEIAATLRAFRDEPTPRVDEAMFERSWNSVRSSLAVLPERRRRSFLLWGSLATASLVALLVAATLLLSGRRNSTAEQASVATAHSPLLTQASEVLNRLHGKRAQASLINNRPGPLTTAPVDAIAGDPAMAQYLESADRLLTEVSHEQGAASPETRSRVHSMLLQNATFQRTAQDRGDLAAAGVMDDLGRVLVSLDAEPVQGERSADAFRLQMSMGSVLFDIRILHSKPISKAAE